LRDHEGEEEEEEEEGAGGFHALDSPVVFILKPRAAENQRK
jgi:hypothetical protein